MKKINILTLFIACLSAICLAFSACTDDNSPAEAGQNVSYKITVEKDDVYGKYYSMNTDKSLTAAGNTVTVSISDVSDFLSVDKVYANDAECTTGSDGTYTFTMPDRDVTVKATFKVNIIPERADRMKWSEVKEIRSGSVLTTTLRVDFGEELILNSSTANADGYSTMTNAKVISTYTDVIPQEALTRIEAIASNNGAYAMAANVHIDATKAKPGKTTLLFIDTDNNRAVSVEITVVE